jgi:hypothetical protein
MSRTLTSSATRILAGKVKQRFTNGDVVVNNDGHGGPRSRKLTGQGKECDSMSTVMVNGVVSCLGQIGDTAGEVWHALNDNGPLSLAKLFERVGGNRDVVMQAVGWLAREGKIDIVETKRGRIVSLRPEAGGR